MAALRCDSKAALGGLFSIDWRWSYASALIAFGRRQRLTAMVGLHQFRITEVHRIPERAHIPDGPHVELGRVSPVALGEQPQLGVVVARMEVDQPGLGVEAFADSHLSRRAIAEFAARTQIFPDR